MIDDYLIERCHTLRKKDFVLVTDFMMRLKMGKKIHLCEFEADSKLNNRIHQNTLEGNLMDYTVIVIITNTLVVLATFIATVYRIKIERDQIQTVKRNVQAKECLTSLRKYIKAERNSISNMNEQELREFLDYLEKLGEC